MFRSFKDVEYSVSDVNVYMQNNCKMKKCSNCKYAGEKNCFTYLFYDAIINCGLLTYIENLKFLCEQFEKGK